MGIKLEAKPVVAYLRENIRHRINKLDAAGVIPTILIIRIGNGKDDISYEKGILKNCDLLGINSQVLALPIDVSMELLIKILEDANKDEKISGILLFRPLPLHLDSEVLSKVIDPAKDIDCMSPVNLEKVFEGKSRYFVPCTARAVVELLKYYKVPLSGANVVVVGNSLVVGKPLTMLLMDENATTTVCHIKTKDTSAFTAKADIVVVAIGKARFMTEGYFSQNSIVVDVGINDAGDGKLCGDVDFDHVLDKVKAITPTIGGIGTITTTILLSHVVMACEANIKAS